MLSRVAERIYWLARYMERAESTARLVNVYSNLLLDLPKSANVNWETLISITGGYPLFGENSEQPDEKSVTRFLLTQKNNPASIFNSLIMARENARTTREIIPSEAWELVNDLYLYAKDNVNRSASRSGRVDYLKRVINSSQQLMGLLSSCMSHNSAYDFVVMGRNVERADMTSRIVDVGAATLMKKSDSTIDIIPYESSLWMHVLKSLNGYQMYRQHVQDRVNGEDVVQFLLLNEEFPRTILHCLNVLASSSSQLPNHDECLRTIASVLRRVQQCKIPDLLEKGTLYVFIDNLQMEFANIHSAIASTWFLKQVEAAQSQSQTA